MISDWLLIEASVCEYSIGCVDDCLDFCPDEGTKLKHVGPVIFDPVCEDF